MTSTSATAQLILDRFPIGKGFRFLTSIHRLEEECIEASHRFDGSEPFYEAHFPGFPVTPGVILTEAMAQTGLVALGMYLLSGQELTSSRFFFTESQVKFSAPVFPGQEITITARKLSFRFGKLTVEAQLRLPDGQVAARGTLSGMILPSDNLPSS